MFQRDEELLRERRKKQQQDFRRFLDEQVAEKKLRSAEKAKSRAESFDSHCVECKTADKGDDVVGNPKADCSIDYNIDQGSNIPDKAIPGNEDVEQLKAQIQVHVISTNRH